MAKKFCGLNSGARAALQFSRKQETAVQVVRIMAEIFKQETCGGQVTILMGKSTTVVRALGAA